MPDYKLAILTAGAGSRLGALGGEINKGLLPLKHKAVISHIIDKFPEDIEIVVVVGHKKDLLKEYLSIAHPERNFSYVEVDKLTGPGSGPGYSLLKAKEQLQCPFVLSAVDTVVSEYVPRPTVNWLGVSPVDDTARFNSIKIKDGFVADMKDKVKCDNTHADIGLSGINDYELFWRTLEADRTLIDGELQISNGLKALMESPDKLCAVEFTWFDTGTPESYEAARRVFDKSQEEFDFSKTNEFTYFAGDRVIKYVKDPRRVDLLFRRAKILEGFVPQIDEKGEHFISYKKIYGHLMHEEMNDGRALSLLAWLKNSFWEKANLPDSGKKEFSDACRSFYEKNTFDRVQDYWNITGKNDGPSVVNGSEVPPLSELLKKVDWGYVADGIPSRFHGNLNLDNVLVIENAQQPFLFLGWGTDFAGLVDYGDLYYDLAALYGGMILPYNLIRKNMFSFKEENGEVSFDVPSSYSFMSVRKLYEEFLSDEGYDLNKIKMITALLFINMSPLHKEPFNFLLHYLGKLELSRFFDKQT